MEHILATEGWPMVNTVDGIHNPTFSSGLDMCKINKEYKCAFYPED